MDITATLDAPCSPAELFGWVGDLARYPEWLSIVTRAVPLAGVEPVPVPSRWRVLSGARFRAGGRC